MFERNGKEVLLLISKLLCIMQMLSVRDMVALKECFKLPFALAQGPKPFKFARAKQRAYFLIAIFSISNKSIEMLTEKVSSNIY